MGKKYNNINFYATLDNSFIKDIKPIVNFEFSYFCKNEIIPLEFIKEKNCIFFEASNWNCDDYDLKMSITLELNNLNKLFGGDGIAPIGSEIGVALEWYSAQSKIRKVSIADDGIIDNDNLKSFHLSSCIPKSTISGSICANLILFLKHSTSKPDRNALHLNNIEGYTIGIIEEYTIFLSGNGSLFPIKIEPLDSNVLWDLRINYSDIEETLLSDGMVLILNSKHKDYHYINPDSKDYCDKLADEIVSNAITMLLCYVRDHEGLDNLNDNCASGSIMEYILYCKNTLEIDFTDSNSISKTVNEYSSKE